MKAVMLLDQLQALIDENLLNPDAEVQVTTQPNYPIINNFLGLHIDSDGNLQLVAGGRDIDYSDGKCYKEDGLVNEALCR